MRTIMLLCLLLMAQISFSQERILFDRLQNVKGLENRSITSILQDDAGFFWFGSQDGLIRYDGYEIKVYKTNLKDKNSIADNNVQDLAKDTEGNLWIATQGGGLNKFDIRHEKFTHYKNNPNDPHSISGNAIWSVMVDSKGYIWAGTFSNGVNRLDPKTNQFKRFQERSSMPVQAIHEDGEGLIWFSSKGINVINPEDFSIKTYLPDDDDAESLSLGGVQAILRRSDKKLWLGVSNGGLYELDPDRGIFTSIKLSANSSSTSVNSLLEDQSGRLWVAGNDGVTIISGNQKVNYRHDSGDKHSLSSNSLLSLYVTKEGTVWIGTEAGGINKTLSQKKFATYRKSAAPGSISHNQIRSIYEDTKSQLWVGTQGGGLNLMEANTKTFRQIEVGANEISAVYQDVDGTYYIGSWGSGLFHYSANLKLLHTYRFKEGDHSSLPDDRIQIIHRDGKGMLWVGTENGLAQLDPVTRSFKQFRQPMFAAGLTGSNVQGQAFKESKTGEIWLGTWFGLNRISSDRQNVSYITSDTTKASFLSSDHVISLHLDDDNDILWIGTFGGGLNKLEIGSNRITHFTEEDGLANNTIFGIKQDNSGNLWLSTNNGLSRFNPETRVFRNYDVTEGLQGNAFFWGAACSLKDGRMVFGGISGLNIFDPAEIHDNQVVPPVVITNFEIFNKSVPVKKGSVLEQGLNFTDGIVLRYDQNVINFQYSALNYNSPEKNLYAYYLENFDQEWNYVGNKRNVSYTNLDPGDYVLHIRGSNNDGVWNEQGVVLNITIIPPFWRTWWFYTLVVIFIVGVVYLIFKLRLRSVRKEKEKIRRTLQDALDKANTDLELQKKAIADEQQKNYERNWVDQSLSIMSETLSRSKDDVNRLCREILSALVKRCQVNAGAIYLIDEHQELLTMAANFGLGHLKGSMTANAGQTGESFQHRKTIIIDNIPEDFVRVESGLGSASPKVLVLVPIQNEDVCLGVIELASFKQIPPYQVQFIETLSAQLTSAIHTTQMTQKTMRLLEESKAQTEEMKVREEELKQNLEEMEAIQEGFSRQRNEYEKTIQELMTKLGGSDN